MSQGKANPEMVVAFIGREVRYCLLWLRLDLHYLSNLFLFVCIRGASGRLGFTLYFYLSGGLLNVNSSALRTFLEASSLMF